ncbi:sorcin-like isoform X1 [Anneissia japonica]|uniref:sorcin-like isoform X1 n=1 Tax=Anneissia japonica TaxID=1529436 RepID=UPI001425A920|nr:sorcin-like isoform X1 [Anneissia japonica]XP_033121528.1 sorcin-like isoform X1 [Anneissia japonica]
MSYSGNQPAYNPNQSYRAPPPQQGYGAPPPYQTHGAPPPQQGYGAPPPQHGYGAPPQHQGYGAPPPYQTHNVPPHQQGYGGGVAGRPGDPGLPPPGANETLWYWFKAVDVDNSGTITINELKQALINGNWSHFNDETCRLMIGMFDVDKNGTIDFNEFSALWKYIQEWKQCFDRFDKDRSGNIDAQELHDAFVTFGYNLSMNFCHLIMRKFDRTEVNSIKFDDFIQCCVMLHSLTESFKRKDANRSGNIRIHYEEFLEMVLDTSVV